MAISLISPTSAPTNASNQPECCPGKKRKKSADKTDKIYKIGDNLFLDIDDENH
ncbi:hypothetical protein LPY66_07290 [Dehalobacter sp. DCM]|uniref:hypothetical protein n=1 Tax=Dehalobacter sp. DCM TaxID=2907827 RepID=UPI003081A9D8|nr:hypothetical protein LPY66_07290 [Dehalobacter sp. DCM]